MSGWREREVIRLLHLVLSVPILGYFYGPVALIPRAAFFARWVAMPIVIVSGLWMWLKPRIVRRILQQRLQKSSDRRAALPIPWKTSI